MRNLTLSLLLLPLVSCAETVTVDTGTEEGLCGGWGVSLCWWAAQCGQWPEERLDSLVDWLTSPEGLNYNVFRYNIGGGDDPEWRACEPHHFGKRGGKGLRAEMEGFAAEEGAPYDWERDEGQRRIMLMIKRKRPDAVFEAFSNSPPWWMTVSGCCAGASSATDDNLAPDMYEAFADYLVDVCLHYRDDCGIEFSTLEPFNEPMTDYWRQGGGQEGCHFDVASQVAFLRVLHERLEASGLSTRLSASDETNVRQSVADLEAYAEAGVTAMLGQWNVHTYEGTLSDKLRLRQLCDSLGIRLWQSETGNGGRGIEGNLRMAQRLVDDIKTLRPEVWCDWQYVEQGFDQWSLVKSDREWGRYERHANYHVRSHFSRFVGKGWRWVASDDEHGLAAVSPDGETLVVVTLNATRRARNVRFALPPTAVMQELYRTSQHEACQRVSLPEGDGIELPPLSIVTAVYRL